MEKFKNIGVVILAAGESNRMKTSKPFLRYDSNRRFIDKIIDEYIDSGINKIVVVANNQIQSKLDFNENIIVVVNEHLEFERYYSIKLGLAKISDCDFCYIQNIDNPFINDVILRKLYFKRNNQGSAIPVFNGRGGHPILLGKDVMNKITSANGSNLNFKDVINEFPSNRVEVNDDSILININTPEDYKKYFN